LAASKLAEFVGKTISEKRQGRKLSQEKLAEMLETSQDIISKIEQGKISIKFGRLEQLASIFKCQVADFFRVPGAGLDNNAVDIADMLNGLPPEDIKLIKGTVAEMVRLLKAKK
jgi:transcriptional regulator with XRE-family HTH domain